MLWRMFRLSRRLWKLSKLHVRMVYLYFTYDQSDQRGVKPLTHTMSQLEVLEQLKCLSL